MPPANNDSQGLKIAVAAFVSLTVILAVTSYFLYSSYSKTSEQLAEATTKSNQAQKTALDTIRDFEEFRTRAGYGKLTEGQAWRDEVKKDQDKANAKLAEASKAVAQMVTAAQQQGAKDQRLADLNQRTDQIVRDFMDEKTTTFASSIDRLVELVSNLSQLTAALAVDNIGLRGQLASVNQVNQSTVGAQEEVVKQTKTDLEKVQAEHEQDRQALVAKLDQFQTLNSQLASENATLKTQMTQKDEESKKQLGDVRAQMNYWKTQASKSEIVLDQADGAVTYVDYTRRELRTNINRSMGAKPQMQMAIFDRNAQGIPTEKPKGTIQLIQVGDTDSVARILTTSNSIDPIREGDQVYSAAWSPNQPKRFALIGKIDIDRDGRDDRRDLVRLIQAAGGEVDYDLPPPGVGKESGELSGQITWYVIDERDPFRSARTNSVASADVTAEEGRFNDKKTAALEKARNLGISPITIERLLPSLGYSRGMTIPGHVQAFDRKASEALTTPRMQNPTPATTGAPK
jgi:hypothetical protein